MHYDVLRAIGAKPTGLRSPIPLYMRVRLDDVPLGLPRTVHLELSVQHLAALILEIPDYHKLRRFVTFVCEIGNKKEKGKDLSYFVQVNAVRLYTVL